MSRRLGPLQRAILDALPAHELPQYPGIYDLKALRLALSKATGRGHTRALRYGSDDTYWYPDEAFAACFSRAVRRLMARGMLTPDVRPYGLAIPDGHWRLPYVRRTD